VKNLENKPFALLGVNVDCYPVDQLKKVVARERLTWRSFVDPPGGSEEGFPGRISKQWNLEGTPTLYLIDHKGVIRYKWLGDSGAKVIDEAIEKLIQEAEANGKSRPK
jgi:peroxiredoxin